jgi:phosphoribosylformylglycinamidine cyclo-ligase
LPERRANSYTKAGVDIDAGRAAVDLMKDSVRSTWGPGVLAEYGGFAGLFGLSDSSRDVLAMTIDGVGTKLKVASMCGRYDSIGMDIVNHCTDDLLVQRARPLLFADYFASSSLDPTMVAEAVSGMASACRAVGCALIAGETAEMPGVYCDGEFDIVGCMLGSVSRATLDEVQPVAPGDALIGLPSTGLHTNGYSLARHLIFEKAAMSVDDQLPEAGCTVGDALLAVHREYLTILEPCLVDPRIHALVHITGGGFFDNVARVLPEGCEARIDKSSWEPLPIFRMLCDIGELDDAEAYRVFNMGIGFVVVVERGSEGDLLAALSGDAAEAIVIGEVEAGTLGVRLA